MHRYKTRFHRKALAQLIKGTIDDEICSSLLPHGPGSGQINGRSLARPQELLRLAHGHNFKISGLKLTDDLLRNSPGGIGHLRSGYCLKRQDQNTFAHSIAVCSAKENQAHCQKHRPYTEFQKGLFHQTIRQSQTLAGKKTPPPKSHLIWVCSAVASHQKLYFCASQQIKPAQT